MFRSMVSFAAVAALAMGSTLVHANDVRDSIRSDVNHDGSVTGGALAQAGFKKASSVSYKVLVRNADGSETMVDEANHNFNVGDEFRLVVEADTDLFLYVFHEGPTSKRVLMVPDREDPKGFVPKVTRGKQTLIPADGYLKVTPPGGLEKLLVFASPVKKPELAARKAYMDPDLLSGKDRELLKVAQDKVFSSAQKINFEKVARTDISEVSKKATGGAFRLRGFSFAPSKSANQGKTVFVGSYKADAQPELFIPISLKSSE